MDKIEKIRQEIERLAKRADRRTDKDHASHNAEMERYGEDYWNGYGDLAYAILSFLDTLSEDPDKSLEEAAYKYSFDSRPCIYGQVDVIDAFKAGAEWQKSQMPMPEDTVLFQKGVAEGRRLEREDMMHDALEGEVIVPIYEGDDIWSAEIKIPGTYKIGDKVRIVVLKAEEE